MRRSSRCLANVKCRWPSSRAATNSVSLRWQAEAAALWKRACSEQRRSASTSHLTVCLPCQPLFQSGWTGSVMSRPSPAAPDTLCSSDPPAVTASPPQPSVTLHLCMCMCALLLSVSRRRRLHLDPRDLTSVCLHPNYPDKLRAGPASHGPWFCQPICWPDPEPGAAGGPVRLEEWRLNQQMQDIAIITTTRPSYTDFSVSLPYRSMFDTVSTCQKNFLTLIFRVN